MRWIRRSLLAVLLFTSSVFVASSNLQADEVKKSPHDKWLPAMQAFEKQDTAQKRKPGGIVFTGSSSIRLWDLPKSFPDRYLLNRGFGGSEIADAVHFVETLVLKHQPHTVVFYAGDNDVAHGKNAKTVAADFRAFVAAVHEKLPKTRILYIAIKPSLKRWNLAGTMTEANQAIAKICAESPLLEYVDIWQPMLGDDGKPLAKWFVKDGLHLNAEGYELWTGIVREKLKAQSRKNAS